MGTCFFGLHFLFWNVLKHFLRRTWCHPEFLSALPDLFDWVCALAIGLPRKFCGFNTHFSALVHEPENGALFLALEVVTFLESDRYVHIENWYVIYCLNLKTSFRAGDTCINLGNFELPAPSLLREIVSTILWWLVTESLISLLVFFLYIITNTQFLPASDHPNPNITH